MALTTGQLTQLKQLHGEKYLIATTNPEADTKPTAIDEDALETAVEATEAWFARRGYSITRTSVELLGYVDLWARVRNIWSAAEKERWQEMHNLYPVVLGSTVSGSTVEAGAEGDRRHFTDEKLDGLDTIRTRVTRPKPGGSL